jgi:hypothetical protein
MIHTTTMYIQMFTKYIKRSQQALPILYLQYIGLSKWSLQSYGPILIKKPILPENGFYLNPILFPLTSPGYRDNVSFDKPILALSQRSVSNKITTISCKTQVFLNKHILYVILINFLLTTFK